ncbi:Alanine aminotransferase 1 [Blattella germanica]|nr:Alanine aminotransferase 1 [Blattella germanica]
MRTGDCNKEVCNPKANVIINPGNPTGQVMSRETVESVVKFSYNHNLMLIADEVYQDNIYEREFISAKKVMHDLGDPYNKIQLVLLYSISKSYRGECGIRGAYMEFQNIDEETLAVATKLQDISLCPNTPGQCVLYATTKPPTECEPSYGLFIKEKNDIICSLATKAHIATDKFNQIEGVKCNEVKGALYVLPKLELPQNVIEKAQSIQIEPDEFYALQRLENTGICMVPGSGFGQKEGIYHLRSTILLPTDKFQVMLEKFKKFHEKFLKEYK